MLVHTLRKKRRKTKGRRQQGVGGRDKELEKQEIKKGVGKRVRKR